MPSSFRPLLHRLHPFNHNITELSDTKNFGTLCMLTQRRPLNIFNVRSKKDSKAFREIILEKGLRHDEHEIRFGVGDFAWIMCCDQREELVNSIKERGYDGFLNYKRRFNDYGNVGKVSMCLFDPLSAGDFVQKSGKEVMSFDAVKELHSFEMLKLMDDVFISMKRGDDKVKIIDDMLSRINNFFRYKTILEEDIERTYEEVSSGKISRQRIHKRGHQKQRLLQVRVGRPVDRATVVESPEIIKIPKMSRLPSSVCEKILYYP